MSDLHNNGKQDNHEENFAELLESYNLDRKEEVLIGDKIRGEIISIGRDKVFIDTGTKIDGVVEKTELMDENGEIAFKMGDTLDLYVVAVSENKIVLSRGFSGAGGLMHLREAYQQSIPVEGKVESQCKGGFNVMVMGKRAFCPISQIDVKYVEKPEPYIGNTYFFLISELEDNGRNIVLTRREILKKEIEAAGESFYAHATIGTVLDGQITRITPYGAFVELQPNIEGMVHISELSWSKIDQPEDIVKIGDPIRVRLMGIERDKTSKRLKISLSAKQVTDNPWNRVGEKFTEGEKVTGRITRCMNFGAFVEIAPGIEGLIHISELSYTKRILHPEDVVKPGDSVSVMIKEIDLKNKRISLSLRDAQGDPWLEVSDKYPVGKSVRGTVEKKEKFGIFISLEPGITGLLHRSKVSKSYDASAIDKLRQGDTLTVVVEDINPRERRISLSPGDSADMENWHHYADRGQSSLGELGEKLQAALKAKK